jgi:histidine triad (HIT) family protein
VDDCRFCAIAAGDQSQHVVAADELTMAFLDIRPAFKGHVLVIPRTHHQTLADLPPDLVAPLFSRVRAVSAAMSAALGADGSFVGVNNTVDQTVPHLHVHVVPRTRRDGAHGTASLMISVFSRILWPRRRYSGDDEAASYAHKLAEVLGGDHPPHDSSAP